MPHDKDTHEVLIHTCILQLEQNTFSCENEPLGGLAIVRHPTNDAHHGLYENLALTCACGKHGATSGEFGLNRGRSAGCWTNL